MSESAAPQKAKTGKGKGKGKGAAKPQTSAATTATAAPTSSKDNYRADHFDALICVNELAGPYIGGSYTGPTTKKKVLVPPEDLSSDVRVQLSNVRRRDATPYDGFILEFAMGAANESTGFGVIYEPEPTPADAGHIEVAKTYKILVSLCFNANMCS
jgi:hypothetical protein